MELAGLRILVTALIVRSLNKDDICLGLPSTEKNIINLGPGCGTAKKILHELLHGVGMYHTHQRWDRWGQYYIQILRNHGAQYPK